MIDLKNTTFIIPIRIDNFDRQKNILTTLTYLFNFFDTNIKLWEVDSDQKLDYLYEQFPKCDYKFIKTNDPHFQKAKIINDMVKTVKTNIICIYDIDIILYPYQYISSVIGIENGMDLVLSYNMNYYNIPKKYHRQVRKEKSILNLPINNFMLISSKAVGGCVFFNINKFNEIGMMNENMKSLGGQDDELIIRSKKLGLKFWYINDFLLHLDHNREKESLHCNKGDIYQKNNFLELNKIQELSVPMLKKYIKTWAWRE